VPGTYSLAGRIIHQWLHGGDVSPSSNGSGAGGASTNSAAGSGQQPAAGSPDAAESPAESSAANASATARNTVLLDRVADVQLDSGTFKYVLLRVATPDGQTKVRNPPPPEPCPHVVDRGDGWVPDIVLGTAG
jgi:hypothetical protein